MMKDGTKTGEKTCKTIEYRFTYALNEIVKINSIFNTMRETNKEIKNILRRLHQIMRLMAVIWAVDVHLD